MAEEKSPLAQLRHDLRTPINHILGYGEMLAEDIQDGDQLADLEKINHAARQLLEMVGARLTDENLSGISLQESVLAATPAKVASGLEFLPPDTEDRISRATGHILIVDDQAENRDVLARRLERQGHTTGQAENGRHALEILATEPYDLILLDVMMPVMDGFTALGKIKTDEALRHIPVIMISALDEIENVVRCIESGAEDFLPKPFNPTLLRARIGASLEKKAFRDQETAYLRRIEETQSRLSEELQEASRYVTSILPEPMETPFRITWTYHPSTELGGDSFGYHWIDDTHFAIYLLDVCGHGVGAALLSVAAINVIRSSTLPGKDFLDPAQVLEGLNDTFQMERHNNMYFTIWYGVYDTTSRTLRHAAGGHPPALMLAAGADGQDQIQQVSSPGMLIGGMPDMTYQSATCEVPPGARLFVYCDGAYEIKRPGGSMLDFDEDFVPYLLKNGRSETLSAELLTWIRTINTAPDLDDDYSFVAIDFPHQPT